MKFQFATFVMSLLVTTSLVSDPATAQRATVKSADAVLVPAAPLYRVEEGVFALRPGMSVDLSDRAVLLSFRQVDRNSISITIAGRRFSARIGTRFNLMRERVTAEAFKDRAQCFLDVTNITTPRGAPPTATFRFNCI